MSLLLNSPLRKEKGKQDILHYNHARWTTGEPIVSSHPPETSTAWFPSHPTGFNPLDHAGPVFPQQPELSNGWDGSLGPLPVCPWIMLDCFQCTYVTAAPCPSWPDDHFSTTVRNCARCCSSTSGPLNDPHGHLCALRKNRFVPPGIPYLTDLRGQSCREEFESPTKLRPFLIVLTPMRRLRFSSRSPHFTCVPET